ncbi:translation initiation factor IF-3 [Candidatus Proelusimicrobium volucris]|uniref:translation initiation factor IF-3 n=1 Tax=Candidatus Proelusimicrobium volucris TaxID=3416225 RepID=UPI003D0B7CD3
MKINNNRSSKDLLRKNEQIRAAEVRLIDEDGTMLGIVNIREALAKAREKELDLVEISPTAQPPVCKILEYSKYIYEQGKKNKDAKKKQKAVSLKEIRLKSRIASHDLEVKVRQIEGFLKKKDMVRVSVVFYGRENQHKDIGFAMLNDMKVKLEQVGDIDGNIQTQGNRVTVTFVPKA